MRRGARWALLALAVLGCLAAWLPVSSLLGSLADRVLDRVLAGRTDVRVHVGSLSAQGLGVFSADDVVVLAPVQGVLSPLLTLDRLTLRCNFLPLFAGGPRAWPSVPRMARLKGLHVMITRGRGGAWNLAALSSPAGAPAPSGRGMSLPFLPLFRVELEDSTVGFDDLRRGFRSTVDQVQGGADLRRFPEVRFSLSGRTEGRRARNLALSGDWDAGGGGGRARLNLRDVAMAGYLNYFLPDAGPRFTAGMASLALDLRLRPGRPAAVAGRAELLGGGLRLPGIRVPLSGLNGGMDFDADSLRFAGVYARFLGSTWTAGGSITRFASPLGDLTLSNPAVPLAVLTRQVAGLDSLDLSGTVAVSAVLRGPLARPRIEADLSAAGVSVRGVEFEGVGAHALWFGRRLEVDRVKASLWGGQVEGSAALDFSGAGSLAADLSVTGALLQLGRLADQPMPLAGLADARATARGPLRSPRVDVGVEVGRLRVGALDLGGVRGMGRFADGRFNGSLESGRGVLNGRVGWSSVAGRKPAFNGTALVLSGLSLSQTVRSLGSLEPWLPCTPARARFWDGLAGRLGGAWGATLTVQGLLAAPELAAEIRLKGGRLGLGPDRSLSLDWGGSLGYAAGALSFGADGGPFDARIGTGGSKALRLDALGSYRLSGRARPEDRLGVRSDADLAFLDAFGFARSDRGRFQAALTVTGRASSPLAFGGLAVSGFSCRPVACLAPVRDGVLTARFIGSAFRIDRLGFSAPGKVSATGAIDFSGGLEAARGTLEASTDPTGVGLENWPGLGSGDLSLRPIRVLFDGMTRPIKVAGRVVLSSARIIYSGEEGARAAAPSGPSLLPPLDLDLRVGLGANVWYDRRQTKGLDFTDPSHWFSDALDSARKSLLEPDLSLGFAPTQRDIVVRGVAPKVDLEGEFFVDRGWVTVMQNDFKLGGSQGPTRISLHGQHADLSGTAAVNLSYARFDSTGRPIQKEVQALALLSARDASDPAAQTTSDQFLDLQLRFDSIPPIYQGDPAIQQTAVLDLVLLGDPVVDIGGGDTPLSASLGNSGATGSISGVNQQAGDPGALLASASLGAVTTGFVRQQLTGLLGRFEIPGANWLDVVRINPRIRYQMVGAVPLAAAGPSAPVQPLSGPAQSSYDVDWTMELGKNVGEKLYATLQALTFGQDARDSVIVANQSDQAVQSYGLRGGAEYHLGPYRDLEAYGEFGCDDYLNPVPYPARWPVPNPSWLVQWRASVPTGNYGVLQARRRRYDGQAALSP